EKEGTFTSTERRVQRVRKAISPPGEARADSEIVALLAERLGHEFESAPPEVFKELARLTPQYAGLSHERLDEGGLQWPCPSPDHPGTPILHVEEFARGKGLFSRVEQLPLSEAPDEDFPLMLTTGRVLYQYHTGSMSRRTALDALEPEALVEVSPADADAAGLVDGEMARVVSRHGGISVRVHTTDRVPPGTVFVPFHYSEAAANILTGSTLDPVAKIPALKTTPVRIEKE
ncbi:MAG: molybdopterin-dependent oxidoreductase, partial [Actinobacteria bacterium]|nr:molybdopterin-dependent oxidoreductase [Actinomycetota bacterium]